MANASKRRNKIYLLTGVVFVVVGFGGLFLPFVPFWFSEDLDALQQLADAVPPVPIITAPASTSASFSPTSVPDYELKKVKNRLAIRSAKVNMPIFESKSASVLSKGGWIFPGTSAPDRGGNTVIFGHRFRYLPPISNTFYHLDKVQRGDTISIAWKGVTYTYRVDDIKIIEPTDWSVTKPTEEARITLITCAPLFSTKQRLVVIASRTL